MEVGGYRSMLCAVFATPITTALYSVCRVEFTLHTRQSSTQNNKYQESHKQSSFSWWLSGMQQHMLLHTRQSSIQNNKYKVSHRYSCYSWWRAHRRPKHVEKKINLLRETVHQVGFIWNKNIALCFSSHNCENWNTSWRLRLNKFS